MEKPKLTDDDIAKMFLTGVPIDITEIPPDSALAKIGARVFNEAFDRDQTKTQLT